MPGELRAASLARRHPWPPYGSIAVAGFVRGARATSFAGAGNKQVRLAPLTADDPGGA